MRSWNVRVVFVALLAIALTSAACARTDGPMLFNMVHHNPGEERWVTDFTEPHHLKKLGYTGQILAYGAQCGLTFDDFEENVVSRHSTERAWIEHHAFECRKYFDKARKVDLSEYPWIDVLVVPKSLMAKYGDEMKGTDGKLSILKPMTERIVRAQLAEFFKLYPSIEGITIRFGETYLHDTPFHVGGSPVHTPDEHARLMNILRDEVCVKRGKTVIYRLWDFAQFHTKPELYLPAANQVEPHEKFLVAFKHCNFDFMRTYPMNANIGLGKHGQIIELSLNQGGCYGKNAYPYYLGKGLIDGFRDDVEGPWRHGKRDIKGLKDIKDWPIIKGYWLWNWGDGWKGPYFSNEFWMRLNETVLRRWVLNQGIQDTGHGTEKRDEESIFMEYAKGDLGLGEEDAAKFRKLCLLSEDAGYYGYHSDVGKIDDWWLRDNYFRAVKLDGFVKAGTLEALYKEKRDNLARWDEIVKLADEIKFPNEEDGHFVRVSSRYGMYKHKIAEIIIRAQGFLATHETDKAKAASHVKEFEDTWSAWEKLRRENPDCPTLYEYESFEFNYSEPLFGRSLKKLKDMCK